MEQPGNIAHSFVLKVNSKVLNFSVGSVGPDELDLVDVLTHEFGHALALAHPSEMWETGFHVEAAMRVTNSPGRDSLGTTRRRDLWQWDLEV